MFLKKLLNEPLTHFLLIGACLFGLYAFVNPNAMQSDKRIVVDEGQIASLKSRFQRVWQREPTKKELQSLIEEYVIEEIYYREALAMGIDKNDPVIRRRLRQKMESFTDNLTATLAASEQELKQYLQRHPEKFKSDSRYTFKHVYINTDRSPEKLQEIVTATQKVLQTGESVAGDSSLLPAQFTAADVFAIDRTFGQGFAAQLDTLSLNTWSPPLRSGLGLHFVMLSERQPGRLPELAAVRDKVEREWRFDRAQQLDGSLRKQLLASYDVIVRKPELTQ